MKYDNDWYDSLIKPKIQPPAWIFAPVWTVLYAMMLVSCILVLLKGFNYGNIVAYVLFVAQLAVNLSWSPVFFKEHNLRKAFLLCVLLAFLVLMTMISFFYISKLAGLLFLPYFLWCCFAGLLCFEILELNED